jgi:hypothetical protein
VPIGQQEYTHYDLGLVAAVASIHRAAEKGYSRKPSFREQKFSETKPAYARIAMQYRDVGAQVSDIVQCRKFSGAFVLCSIMRIAW